MSEYLPWFRVESATPDDPLITIEHLLTHSSGLPREAGSHWSDWEFPTQEELRELIPEAASAIFTRDPMEVLEPGVHHRGDDRRSGER